MCGVAGIYYFNEKPPGARETVQTMASTIAHRGSDDQGIFENECLVLAHQRLSIIDLETGHQPMFNEGGVIVTVCNGEIYNYQELRGILTSKGHTFTTSSDTEVLLHLYEEHDLHMFDHLNGIFAFALWDGYRKRLILARDHLGVKPLHFLLEKDRVLFGSEIKAILAGLQTAPRLNKQAFHYFMNLRYVPGRKTLFKGVERLLPGECAVVDRAGLRRRSFWKLPEFGTSSLSEGAAIEGVREHLQKAVSRQLIADVPLGFYLSGGMDSSSVLAMARQAHENRSFHTYTLGFNEPTDELEDAKKVADYFRAGHQSFSVNPKPLASLAEVIWHVEEPKVNMLQGYLLAHHVRQFVKVALAGLGGDELFAGYAVYRFMKPSEPLHRLTSSRFVENCLQPLTRFILCMQDPTSHLRFDQYRRGGHLLLSLGDRSQYYGILRNVWDYDPRRQAWLYGPRMLAQRLAPTRTVFEPYFANSKESFVQQALRAEFNTKLVDDFLLNEDRVSMAHGLEVRVPLLDKELVDFAVRLPIKMKLRSLETKYIFKKAMRGILPDFVLSKKKWGFTFDSYYQFSKDLKATAERVLTPSRVKDLGLFNYEFVKAILRYPPHPGLRWHYFMLWLMVGFHIWHDIFLSGNTLGYCHHGTVPFYTTKRGG